MGTNMKRLIPLLLLLLCCAVQSHAGMNAYIAGSVASVTSAKFPCQDATHLGDGTAVYKCEDFEGATSCESGSGDSNCRSTWVAVDACSTAVDYSSTASPLSGTNSALFNEASSGSACSKTVTYTGDSTYVYARIKVGAFSIDAYSGYPLAIRTDTTSVCALLIKDIGEATTFGVWAGEDVACSSGCITPTQGQEYYVWLEYVKGTSCTAYVSTTATKPASSQATDTTGIPDTAANIVRIWSFDTTNDYIDETLFDNIAISASQLGTLE